MRLRARGSLPFGHVIILEPLYSGHRMSYCAILGGYGTDAGLSLALATSREALSSEEFRMHVGAKLGKIEIIDVGNLPSWNGIRYQRWLRAVLLRLQCSFPDSEIVVLEGDKFVLPASLAWDPIDRGRLRVLIMRAPRASLRPFAVLLDLLKALGMVIMIWRGATVRVLAPATTERPVYTIGPWRAAPDPIDVVRDGECRPAELQVIHEDPGRQWVGVLGYITRRKNLDVILEAVYTRGPAEMGLVVAGKAAEDELKHCADLMDRFRRDGGRIVLVNRLLTDAELDSCILAVDTVVLAHSSEGPSGILGKAVALGTPVVAAGARSLRKEAIKLSAGTCCALESGAIAEGLLRVRFSARNSIRMANSGEFARAFFGD